MLELIDIHDGAQQTRICFSGGYYSVAAQPECLTFTLHGENVVSIIAHHALKTMAFLARNAL